MLLPASKKAGYPVVELTMDTKGLDLLEKYLVVYFIKGFAEVDVEHVSIFVEVEIADYILNVIEKLSEAVLAFLETVLIRVEHVSVDTLFPNFLTPKLVARSTPLTATFLSSGLANSIPLFKSDLPIGIACLNSFLRNPPKPKSVWLLNRYTPKLFFSAF